MMGPLLALDSSTDVGSAAVGDGTGVFAESVLRVAGGHSAALLPAVDQVLGAARLRPADLTGVVVGGGPGSFTGLRIAAATAKGIVQALGVPLYSYSGLLAAAVSGWGAEDLVCALFDARRRDVYAACYRFSRGGGTDAVDVVMEPTALTVDELVERLGGGRPPLLVGEGAVLHREELEGSLGARIAPPHLGIPRASALLWLASNAPALGLVADAAGWEPEYVRASGAERIAEQRRLPESRP
ncbi:MAG: tRNA (adenosine(37)-N6)-threonylcarbamoyltransferase complex dimerization subunit type 1 TsaB [Gemmatimonadetes bacterium]|nr:tRNA (adenosine(37)-N6)-threonylcarbamoyltransferase complex dimerization subunit type 1 TsaB [Gemmatimonadota bacterium]